MPGSSLFAQPDPASVEGGLGNSLFAQPGPASAKGSLAAVVPYAFKGLGHSYVWGGTSFAHGWDCSGFAQWAFAQAGFYLPRVSQWEVLAPTNTPRPGDLVTQRPDGPNHWAHVGIYIGDGMMISALNPDQGTIIHSVGPPGTSWYFTLPGNENIPYGANERESGASQPRATPPVRFSVPSTIADTRHNGGNDGQDRSENRRKASGGDNDRDRPRHKAGDARDDGPNKRSDAGQDQRSNDRDPKRDNKTEQKNSKPGKNQQDRGKDETRDKNQTVPKDPKPNKTPKDDKPDKTPTPPPTHKPKPKPEAPAPPPVQETTPPPEPKPEPKPVPVEPPVQETTPPPPPAPEPVPAEPPVQETAPPPEQEPVPTTPPVQETAQPPATTQSAAPNISGNLNAAVGALASGPAAVQALGTMVSAAQPGDIILYTDAATGKSHVAVYTGGGMVTGADGTQSPIAAGGKFQIIRPA